MQGPADAQASGRVVVWLQANIHAREVEGKEAAQMILRDLAFGPLRPLLDSVVILVVPIYNPDGNDSLGRRQREPAGPERPRASSGGEQTASAST